MKKQNFISATAFLFTLGTIIFPKQCFAPSVNTNISVTATVVAACTIASNGNIAFGNYTGAQVDYAGSELTVNCTNQTPYHIRISLGNAPQGSQRRLAVEGNAPFLNYNLFRNNGYSDPWGTTDNTDTIDANGTGNNVVYPIYARLPASATPTPGVYSDQVVATVAW